MALPSFAFELMRRSVLSLAVKHPKLRSVINPRQSAAITNVAAERSAGYDDASLGVAERLAEFSAGPQPGAVLLECPVSIVEDGTIREGFLTDLVSPQSTVFYFTEDRAIPEELSSLCDKAFQGHCAVKLIPLARQLASTTPGLAGLDQTGKLFALYGAKPSSLYLVRPDARVMVAGARWHPPTYRPRLSTPCTRNSRF